MACDFDGLLSAGGLPLLEFLHYCVYTVQLDPVFLYLVEQYRLTPTAPRALALYDNFCAPDAPARLRTTERLPPRAPDLARAAVALRAQLEADEQVPGTPWSNRALFDVLAASLRGAEGGVHAATAGFDPALTAFENLPGRTMNTGQRAFKDGIWLGRVRPRLVSAGFARVSTVGP